jgi:transcriptional regulator with XRE-family HTH domain
MELQFKPERITIIKRLKGLSIQEIDRKMRELSGLKHSMNIDRWEKKISKHPVEKVELLAKATGVPIGFYFYNNVKIEMKDLKVEIFITETNEKIEFDFL